jgi:poly(A) polymerase
MREIWMMQPRFEKRTGHTPFSLVEQPRFRAAFDFMRLRADIGEVDDVLADWWQDFSQASDIVREDLVAALRDEQQKQQRKVRRVPKSASDDEGGRDPSVEAAPAPAPAVAKKAVRQPEPRDEADEGEQGGEGEQGATTGEAPRKRRRRRRKPSGQGGAGGDAQAAAPSGGDIGD